MSLQAALEEIKRRIAPQEIYDDLFEEQCRVVNDEKKHKAILTPRRAAKSWTICSLMIMECLRNPHSRCLYLGLTRHSVKRIAWELIHKILRGQKVDEDGKLIESKRNISFKTNKVELTIEFPNGATIELGGADSTTDAVEKYLGAAFDIIAIDEAGSFDPIVLDYLIDVVLEPTLVERKGTLILAGTPRVIETGRFFDVTTNPPEKWGVHQWDTSKNPYVVKTWLAKIAELKAENPNIENEAWFVREYLGRWCKDTTDMVYRFESVNNLVLNYQPDTYQYVIGLDIGWEDASAFVVTGYSKHRKDFIIFESFKKSHMLPDAIARSLKSLQARYQPSVIVADASNKTVIQEISTRYGVAIIPAEKQKKADWIELFNVDLTLKRIKIVQNTNCEYIKEISELPWKYDKKGNREEHPAYENHIVDAALYAFRYSYHYRAKPVKKKTEEDKMMEWAIDQDRRKKNWRRYGIRS